MKQSIIYMAIIYISINVAWVVIKEIIKKVQRKWKIKLKT